jgi:L-arabinonolactonase
MSESELIDAIEVGNTLGECVLWHDEQQAIWWTDIQESKLYQYDFHNQDLKVHSMPERVASFGFTENDDVLVCAFASGFALYNVRTQTTTRLDPQNKCAPGLRFNDGRVDRQGRFWAGTMVEDAEQLGKASGHLYCLAGTDCRDVLSGIGISNSLCWSPDSRTLYFADSTTHCINAYPFDAHTNTLGTPTLFSKTTPPYEPDGSTVDADGYLWNALWGGGKVRRYCPENNPEGNPQGTLAEEINLPVSQPTCVAFGGRDLNLLLVTSAKVGISPEQLQKEPQAGNLLIYRTNYTGLPESRFKL